MRREEGKDGRRSSVIRRREGKLHENKKKDKNWYRQTNLSSFVCLFVCWCSARNSSVIHFSRLVFMYTTLPWHCGIVRQSYCIVHVKSTQGKKKNNLHCIVLVGEIYLLSEQNAKENMKHTQGRMRESGRVRGTTVQEGRRYKIDGCKWAVNGTEGRAENSELSGPLEVSGTVVWNELYAWMIKREGEAGKRCGGSDEEK